MEGLFSEFIYQSFQRYEKKYVKFEVDMKECGTYYQLSLTALMRPP
jgi:hypothetical protein